MPVSAFPSEAVTAIAALLGASFGAFLTHKYNRNRDHLELKRDVLRRLMGYRWQLATGHKRPDGLVHTALNEIPVVFAGDADVESAFKTFRKQVDEGFQGKDLIPLAQAMAKSAKIPHKRWSQSLIERPLTPPAERHKEHHP